MKIGKEGAKLTIITKKQISKLVSSKIKVDSNNFNNDSNLIEYGLNSIGIIEIVNDLRKYHVKVSFAQLMEKPSINDWYNIAISNLKDEHKTVTTKPVSTKKYPLSDVQYSYLIGRRDNQVLGGVSCQVYFEFEGSNLNVEKFKTVWKNLFDYHPMLSAKFNFDGTQELMNTPFSTDVIIHNLKKSNQDKIKMELDFIRKKNSQIKLAVEKGEVIKVEISLLPNNKYRLHLNIDMLVADVLSIKNILDTITNLYNDKKAHKYSKEWVIENYFSKINIPYSEESKIFWEKKVHSLPSSPDLTLRKQPKQLKTKTFKRVFTKLSRTEYQQLKNFSKKFQTTPAMILLTIYIMVLERWGSNEKILLNIPLFNRMGNDSSIEESVADYTNILIFDIDCTGTNSFEELLKKVIHSFFVNAKYSDYSGIKILSKINNNSQEKITAPIVFSCTTGKELISKDIINTLGKIKFMISQTPQVFLDFQSFESDNELYLAWDYIEEIFPSGMINEMFESLKSTLLNMINNKYNTSKIIDVKSNLKKERLSKMKVVPHLKNPAENLVSFILSPMTRYSENIAIICSDTNERITYKKLKEKVNRLANLLQKSGINKGELVAVSLPRGIDQIVSVLAILVIGAVYVPIGLHYPKIRREEVYKNLRIKYVISDTNSKESVMDASNTKILNIDESKRYSQNYNLVDICQEDTAYVILTSGTTGIPKGVEISHQGALNTIKDVSKRCRLTEKDTILAISSLDFDLSVFDIFGLLRKGGTIVTISEKNERDALYWLKLISKYNVSIWNSAPMLFEMLVTAAENSKILIQTLRIVLLSGDWITKELAIRLKALVDQSCRFIAMGGATEASIWSNWYEVSKPIPENWNSIPYGEALDNQIYRILDNKNRECPNWVIGELVIGGVGVAIGYYNDTNLTKEKFFYENGMKWYKTGDLGMSWADGTIEFLGRKDNQIKLNGIRIELSEIENTLKKIPCINNAIAIVQKKSSLKTLIAYLEIPYSNKCYIEEIKEFLKDRLPNSMIPSHFVIVDSFPLTTNGKIDRNLLSSKNIIPENNEEKLIINFKSNVEEKLFYIWKDNLELESLYYGDNYFSLGGNSLTAINLLSEINNTFSTNFDLSLIFDNLNFKEQTDYILRTINKSVN